MLDMTDGKNCCHFYSVVLNQSHHKLTGLTIRYVCWPKTDDYSDPVIDVRPAESNLESKKKEDCRTWWLCSSTNQERTFVGWEEILVGRRQLAVVILSSFFFSLVSWQSRIDCRLRRPSIRQMSRLARAHFLVIWYFPIFLFFSPFFSFLFLSSSFLRLWLVNMPFLFFSQFSFFFFPGPYRSAGRGREAAGWQTTHWVSSRKTDKVKGPRKKTTTTLFLEIVLTSRINANVSLATFFLLTHVSYSIYLYRPISCTSWF